jgi:hypothetical protein
MSACKQQLNELDAAMWELHKAAKGFGESNLGGFVRTHVVVDRSPNGRSVGQSVWIGLKIFSRGKPASTNLSKPSCVSTEKEWKEGGRSYLENGGGRHKKSKEEVNGLIEKVSKVQELNAQRLVSQEERKEQTPEPDGQQSSDDGASDRESTQNGESTKASTKRGSLQSSNPSTTGAESNNQNQSQ